MADTELVDVALGDIDLLDLEVPTVVTAARHEQRITAVPFAISVVTAEDIRLCGARTLADALRLVPGVDVAELTWANQAISPRGFHGLLSNQTLVLVDGRQIFDAVFGGTLWNTWPIHLENIERIEVIRGPGSLTWGANAVNGVINIITKDPIDQQGLTLVSRAGCPGMAQQYAGYGGTRGDVRYHVSARYAHGDGYRHERSFLGDPDDAHRISSLSFDATRDLGENKTFSLSLASGVTERGFPPMPLGGIGAAARGGSEASHIMAVWSHTQADGGGLEVTAYVNDYRLSGGLKVMDYRYQQAALQLRHTFIPRDGHDLTWGMDTRLDLVDASYADPQLLNKDHVQSGAVGLYVQDRWMFAEAWSLDLGARIDYDAYGGFEPSARLAVAHEFEGGGLVYGALSRAFQMAPGPLQFVELPLLNGLAYLTSAPDTETQKVTAYELGYRDRLRNAVDLGAVLFWHEYRDLTTLSMELGPPGLIRVHNDNRAEASTWGVELDARWQVANRWSIRGAYTFGRTDWRSKVPFQDEDYMTMPEHKVMLGSVYSPTDDWHLSAQLYYVDEVEAPNPDNPLAPLNIDDYLRLDVRSELEFDADRVAVAVGVKNLLDNHHPEAASTFIDNTDVPRMVYIEVRVRLDKPMR